MKGDPLFCKVIKSVLNKSNSNNTEHICKTYNMKPLSHVLTLLDCCFCVYCLKIQCLMKIILPEHKLYLICD